MKFSSPTDTRDDLELNLTPLIDVVLVLIIFFVLTTTFVRQDRLRVDLPTAGSARPVLGHLPAVSVDARGQYSVAGHRLASDSEAALMAALRRMVPARRERRRLLIRADGRASHQSVVTVMDAAARLGFDRIDMATRRAP